MSRKPSRKCPSNSKFCLICPLRFFRKIFPAKPARKIVIGVIGNPNVGKSTLFNELTGAKQYVANWPGKTVEKKEGIRFWKGCELHFVDLPGTYSLSASSLDELVSREFILNEKPDVIIDIVDASNLERHLYLFLELAEMGARIIIALNKIDIAKAKGIQIDVEKLSKLLGTPVISTVATRGEGISRLCDAIVGVALGTIKSNPVLVKYSEDVEEAIRLLEEKIRQKIEKHPSRWIAIRLLLKDRDVINLVSKVAPEIIKEAEKLTYRLEKKYGQPIETIIAEQKYRLIEKIVSETVKYVGHPILDITDLIDTVVLNKYLAIPIFISILWAIFLFTFDAATFLVEGIDFLFEILADFARNNIPNELIASLITDGIIAGLGSVLVFVPNIFFLFLAVSFLEDSGYFARAAFIFDRIMRKVGLHGKSVIPLILGLGCNVPAVMATRGIESEEDRLLTIAVAPLIPCSARFPVFILLAGIFFGKMAAIVMLSMYLLGFALAFLIALIVRKIFYKGRISPFIVEMPPYSRPSLKSISLHMWIRGSHFLKKAGGIIFLMSIIIWFLASMPPGVEFGGPESYAGIIGKSLEFLFKPLGFDWRIVTALIFGFVAKEVVIDSLGVLLGQNLEEVLPQILTPISAYALMVFVLIYTPCIATIATIRSETHSWKWTLFVVAYELILAYLLAFLIVFIGNLIF